CLVDADLVFLLVVEPMPVAGLVGGPFAAVLRTRAVQAGRRSVRPRHPATHAPRRGRQSILPRGAAGPCRGRALGSQRFWRATIRRSPWAMSRARGSHARSSRPRTPPSAVAETRRRRAGASRRGGNRHGSESPRCGATSGARVPDPCRALLAA